MAKSMMTQAEFDSLKSDMRKMFECMKRMKPLAEKYPNFHEATTDEQRAQLDGMIKEMDSIMRTVVPAMDGPR